MGESVVPRPWQSVVPEAPEALPAADRCRGPIDLLKPVGAQTQAVRQIATRLSVDADTAALILDHPHLQPR
ncbi:hypothetical protein [Kribbella sp. VKM Ac-2568]|uniref:hypothetical protein n=1 Tax=Kribbella sp. VKM Ac-2568 TaxID=2512219 RepID=UPI00104DCF04|nr:hypothetical protein [Kribbella sp. VKM Ac-2568]TCM40948.1 hypothetical protein EV648_1122 [Kribbella sp. VKM Ac-2568]